MHRLAVALLICTACGDGLELSEQLDMCCDGRTECFEQKAVPDCEIDPSIPPESHDGAQQCWLPEEIEPLPNIVSYDTTCDKIRCFGATEVSKSEQDCRRAASCTWRHVTFSGHDNWYVRVAFESTCENPCFNDWILYQGPDLPR